jgi:hypothetical protein
VLQCSAAPGEAALVRTQTRRLDVLGAGLALANLGCSLYTWATISPGCDGLPLATVIAYASALALTVVSIVVGIANDLPEGSLRSLGGAAWIVTGLLAPAQLLTGIAVVPSCSN